METWKALLLPAELNTRRLVSPCPQLDGQPAGRQLQRVRDACGSLAAEQSFARFDALEIGTPKSGGGGQLVKAQTAPLPECMTRPLPDRIAALSPAGRISCG
jgi:hypothetical protein